jgi:hypothetical protein
LQEDLDEDVVEMEVDLEPVSEKQTDGQGSTELVVKFIVF